MKKTIFIVYHLFHIDADIRLVRRISRDIVERGRDVNSVLEQVNLSFYDYLHMMEFYVLQVVTVRGWK